MVINDRINTGHGHLSNSMALCYFPIGFSATLLLSKQRKNKTVWSDLQIQTSWLKIKKKLNGTFKFEH